MTSEPAIGGQLVIRRQQLWSFLLPFLTFLLLILLVRPVGCETPSPAVIVDPKRLTIEIGDSGEITCSVSDTTGTLTWLDPFGLPVGDSSAANSSRIWFDADTGVLSVSGAEVNDTGDYMCVINETTQCDYMRFSSCNVTMPLKVYIMPDYLVDGIVVLVINVVLLFVFVGCLIRSAVVDRRRLQKYGQKL